MADASPRDPKVLAEQVTTRIIAICGTPYQFQSVRAQVLAAIRSVHDAALREAADLAEAEATAYFDNAKACDASGNTFGGSMDTTAGLACKRIAAALRARADAGRDQ